jgi:hypothetical protein
MCFLCEWGRRWVREWGVEAALRGTTEGCVGGECVGLGGRGGARPLACLERLWNCAAALLSLRRIRVNTVVEVVCVRVTCCGGECEADPGPLRPSVECRSTFCVVVLCRVVLRGAGVALGCAVAFCAKLAKTPFTRTRNKSPGLYTSPSISREPLLVLRGGSRRAGSLVATAAAA